MPKKDGGLPASYYRHTCFLIYDFSAVVFLRGLQASSQLGSADQFHDCRTRKKQKLKNYAHGKIVFVGLGSRNLCTCQFLPFIILPKPTKRYAI